MTKNVRNGQKKEEADMKKYLTKISAALLIMAMCIIGFGVVSVQASMNSESIDYRLGETSKGKHHSNAYYKFVLKQKSHVSLKATTLDGEVLFSIYNSSGKAVMVPGNVTFKQNNATGKGSARVSKTLNAGTYYLEVYAWDNVYSDREYYFKIQAEPLITLSRGSITSLKSKKAGQATVVCKAASNAIGYRIQYSTDYRFRKGVKTIYSPTRTKTLTKLAKGKRYYVKVCPFTVYDDGEYVFGMNSYVKAIYVRKK